MVEKTQEIKVGNLTFSGLPLNSYLIGNLGLVVHSEQLSFYFLEGLIFNTLLDNRLLTPPHFLTNLFKFLAPRRKYSYLITSLQGLH